MDPLWNPAPLYWPEGAQPAKEAPIPAVAWRTAQVLAAPDLNGMTAPGAWSGLPWFVPGPVAGAPYYA